jgi:uncharacterized SAM-dependent methyltransferase
VGKLFDPAFTLCFAKQYRDVKKIIPLLDAFEKQKLCIHYYALDLSSEVLRQSVDKLSSRYQFVQCFGLWGTFNHGLEWVKRIQGRKCYVSLGSMFGNDHFDAAVQRLKAWSDIMAPTDRMLLGLDATQDKETIWKSYHDAEGYFHQFIINGFNHSNEVLGQIWYNSEDWKLSGEFVEDPLMHRFVMTAQREVRCEQLCLLFPKNTRIVCYEGFKYEPARMRKQFAASSLQQIQQWLSPSGRICKLYSNQNCGRLLIGPQLCFRSVPGEAYSEREARCVHLGFTKHLVRKSVYELYY